MLEKINMTEDLKQLSAKEKVELADEIRRYVLEIVSKNGGHLASNLGVVELTIALHSVFNVPKEDINKKPQLNYMNKKIKLSPTNIDKINKIISNEEF